MPNDGGGIWPDQSRIQEDRPMSATQLRAIVDALARRITGDDKTIRVRSFPGGQIIIEAVPGTTQTAGSPFSIKRVSTLPPIPQAGFRFVIFEDKLWFAYAEYERWYCLDQYTDADGTPGSEE